MSKQGRSSSSVMNTTKNRCHLVLMHIPGEKMFLYRYVIVSMLASSRSTCELLWLWLVWTDKFSVGWLRLIHTCMLKCLFIPTHIYIYTYKHTHLNHFKVGSRRWIPQLLHCLPWRRADMPGQHAATRDFVATTPLSWRGQKLRFDVGACKQCQSRDYWLFLPRADGRIYRKSWHASRQPGFCIVVESVPYWSRTVACVRVFILACATCRHYICEHKVWGRAWGSASQTVRGEAGWCFIGLCFGDVWLFEQRPFPQWSLARVSEMLYGMEGCEDTAAYEHFIDKLVGGLSPLPILWGLWKCCNCFFQPLQSIPASCFTHTICDWAELKGKYLVLHNLTELTKAEGRSAVLKKWPGSEAQLRFLAHLPCLSTFEWKDALLKLESALDADLPDSIAVTRVWYSSTCALLFVSTLGVVSLLWATLVVKRRH